MSKLKDAKILNIIETKGCLDFPLYLYGSPIFENTASGEKVKKMAADSGRRLCSEMEAEAKEAEEKAAAKAEEATKKAEAYIKRQYEAKEQGPENKGEAKKEEVIEKISLVDRGYTTVQALTPEGVNIGECIRDEDALIALTKSHFRHIAGSLMHEDFKTRYFNNNTPLHIIFSFNETIQSLSAMKKLQELFNDGEMSGDELRNIFEAENAARLTPIEVLLENSTQIIGAVSLAIKRLEFLNIFLNANSKNGTICEIAGKRLYEESQAIFYKELEKITAQTTEHAFIVRQCLDKFVTSFMAEIMSELNLALYKHHKIHIKTKTSELYNLVQSNDALKAKFLDLVNIESIDHVVTDVYSRDVIKDKLKLIEENEKLRIDGLLEHDINMVNIELSFSRIANLNTTLYKSGLLDNNFGYTVVRAIKAKLNIVLNKAIQCVKIANEQELKNVYEVALKNVKAYEIIYTKRGFDDLEQHLKNAVNIRVSDFLQGVCKPQEKYRNQQEAGECWDKLYALKQQYSFLRTDLCFLHKAAGEQYLEEDVQDINNGKNGFGGFTCKQKVSAISVPLAIAGAVGLYMSGSGMAGAAIASGMLLLGLDVNKEIDATHSIFIGSSIGAAVVGLPYLEHGAFYVSKAAAIGSIIGGALTGTGEVIGTVIENALDCE